MKPVYLRLVSLWGILVLGLGSIWLLPTQPERPEPGVSMELPLFVGDWVGVDEEVSQREREILGADTTFARKSYTNGRGQHVFVSIVLSGREMNVSIHRPEWCLPAQGYTIIKAEEAKVPFAEGDQTFTRLYNRRELPLIKGGTVTEYSYDYYWFIGATETSHSHTIRNLIDIRDRLLLGYNQPWAFVMVISRIGKGLQPFGLDDQQTDAMLQDFLKDLVPAIQKTSVKKR